MGPEDRSVGLSPTVHKVACGGVEHVPFEQYSQFHPKLEELKKQGYWVFGLSHKAEKNLFEIKIPEKVIWVLGAEDKGLRTTTERVCDELVCLPQADAAASYNVSVAAGMTLIETLRQRQVSSALKSNIKKST
jgi:23S rRNA (guanosine2251-2'-O)-methyltransferase